MREVTQTINVSANTQTALMQLVNCYCPACASSLHNHRSHSRRPPSIPHRPISTRTVRSKPDLWVCVRIAMAGWLHGVFVGDWLFVFPLCGFSLSLFCNYFQTGPHALLTIDIDHARSITSRPWKFMSAFPVFTVLSNHSELFST